jgi:hypothetical protein
MMMMMMMMITTMIKQFLPDSSTKTERLTILLRPQA